MNLGATRPSRVALVLAKRRTGADECTVAIALAGRSRSGTVNAIAGPPQPAARDWRKEARSVSDPHADATLRFVESRVHVITLAVSDLDRALAFYREGLGLDSTGITGTDFVGDDESPAGDVAMFHLDGNLILALYPRTELAKDAQVPFGPPKSGEFSIGHLVATKEHVDALLAQAEAAGATLTGPPHNRPWGIYSGYFRDLDGHLWEIIWNPRA